MAWTISNHGKNYLIANAISGTTDLRMGVFKTSTPTVTQIQDSNTVTDLLGFTTEAAASGYARKDLAGVTVTENDTDNRVDITWTNPTWTTVAAGETWLGVFLYIQTSEELIGVDDTNDVPTNGSDITYSGGSLQIT